jgi:hypothetical protein
MARVPRQNAPAPQAQRLAGHAGSSKLQAEPGALLGPALRQAAPAAQVSSLQL